MLAMKRILAKVGGRQVLIFDESIPHRGAMAEVVRKEAERTFPAAPGDLLSLIFPRSPALPRPITA